MPLTSVVSKQLLPVYDKPMIYYPLSILMLAGIRDILIITTPFENQRFKELFGTGEHLGLSIQYAIQGAPLGIPDAFIIGEEFIGESRVCLILGDNLFYGDALVNQHVLPCLNIEQPAIFGYHVNNPQEYGVIEFGKNQEVMSIEEKPFKPKSSCAVTGLYIFNADVVDVAKKVPFSNRGEKEISDVINYYLHHETVHAELFGRGIAWLDAGTPTGLLEASNFVRAIVSRQGMQIACLEEIAYLKGYISYEDIITIAKPIKNTDYGRYLMSVCEKAINKACIDEKYEVYV
ncbi:glucose-1-phosphate thymidylyltransferase [Thiotrichales bacterium 19S11-10]|nr:glucose-1-phosphate thymidylyltransferase [Thiotrichales bacterium 19S11-10]